jgi:hypothetical protein
VAAGGVTDARTGYCPEETGRPQASRAGEAQRVWNFLGQTDAALVLLGFSHVRTGHPAPKIGIVLLLLDLAGTKMS